MSVLVIQIIYLVFAIMAFLGVVAEGREKNRGYVAVFAVSTLAIAALSIF